MADTPKFGKAQKAPPSWFARLPTKLILDKRFNDRQIRIAAMICSYANNQGFAWPNQATLCEQLGYDKNTMTRAINKLKKTGAIEIVSKYRSHPKWRHVMGNVYRIVYDKSLSQDDLIKAMDKDDPPPVEESAIPVQNVESNQTIEKGSNELVETGVLCNWFVVKCNEITGQTRLVTPRAINEANRVLESMSVEQVKVSALARLNECRAGRLDPPHHLGWLA